jgi:hypothetical protein
MILISSLGILHNTVVADRNSTYSMGVGVGVGGGGAVVRVGWIIL